ncbi:hypothetical protein Catovirus_2_310 [Catovirus CTV1]|uniref:Uncharacterized protein n=1 Tax=Catovirus CTV1 TaxID=1977631 RepID=A0A1V0SCE6_9VIRU|nr:hypothetical protein Catovirus_2_310 [Catovirus CTV1]
MNSVYQEQQNNCYKYECNQKGCSNIGASNRLKYDACEYQKKLYESTRPIQYQMSEYKFENCGKCVYDKFYRPFDLVDVESELKNITRPQSKCPQFKYSPNCKQSNSCLSTYDNAVPVVFAPEICPIVKNNIPRMTTPGYTLSGESLCGNNRMHPESRN